jgi:hypothetical protein
MGAVVAGLLIVALAGVWDFMYLRDVAQTQVQQLLEQRVVAHAHRGHVEAASAYLRAAGLGSAESATGPLATTLAGTLAQLLRPADRFARLEILAVSALHLWLRLTPYYFLGRALQAACRNDHAHLVQVLLAEGVPYTRLHHPYASRVVCLQTRGGWPLLCFAARNGSLAVMRVLLRNGASVHERTHGSSHGPCSAVSVALWHGQWCAAALLLDAKASVTWDPPLALACSFPEAGENGVVERLLHCKVDVNAMSRYGNTDTPLATAVSTASVSMVTVRLLVQAKASVNAAVRFPPLMRAVARGHREAVQCLCAAKADVNFENYHPLVTLTSHSWPRERLNYTWPRQKQFFLPASLFLTDYAEDSVMRDFYHQACLQVLGLPEDAAGSLDGEHGRNRRACISVLLRAKATLPLQRTALTHSGISEMMDAAEHVAFSAV